MNGDPRDAGSSPGDDLFDLPSDASHARDVVPSPSSAAGMDLELPASALPKREAPTAHAGPPLSNVGASPAAIAEQVRKRPAKADAQEPAHESVAALKKPRFARPSGRWIAFGTLGLVNALVLGFVVLRGSGPPKPEHTGTPELATAASALPLGEQTGAAHGAITPAHEVVPAARPEPAQDSPPTAGHEAASAHDEHRSEPKPKAAAREIPALFDGNALDLARKSLKDAREDVASGRRGAARARLGRIGLAIDAIQPAQREDIRAEVALLLAQTIQADADEAARSK